MSIFTPEPPPVPAADLSLRQWCLVLAADKVPHTDAAEVVAAANIFESYLIEKAP